MCSSDLRNTFQTKEQDKSPAKDIKRKNICIIGVPEGEEREKGPERIFEEIIVEKFPKMGKEIATQVQERESHTG